MGSTSVVAAQIGVEGLLLQVGNGASPEVFTTIANMSDLDTPTIANTVETTNLGDQFVRRFPTLLDMGKITFNMYYVMTDPTMANVAGVGSVPDGLRYLMLNKILSSFQIVYPDAPALEDRSVDLFSAYVTSFKVTGKVNGVFTAAVELSTSGPVTLC